jgi:hypothetical protein
MVDLSQSSAQNDISNELSVCDRVSPMVSPTSAAEKRQKFRDMIHGLESIIAVQQDRMNAMQHRSRESSSRTRRLGALMKDNLITCEGTLQQVRQTAHA